MAYNARGFAAELARRGLLPKIVVALRHYDRRQALADLTAGVTVGLVALPLAMAFAISSGLSPQAGLYTAVVAGGLISAFGGSRTQIGGPTGAFVVIVAGIVAKHGVDGLFMCTLIAGILLVAFGVTGMGSGGFAAQPNFSHATNRAASTTGTAENTTNNSTGKTEQRSSGLLGSAPSGNAGGSAHAGAAGTEFGAGGSADSSYATNTASNAAGRGMSAANGAANRGEGAANSAAGKASDAANSASLDAGGSAGASTNRNASTTSQSTSQ